MRIKQFAYIIFVLLIGVLLWQCGNNNKKEDKPVSPYLGLSDSAHYVGINICKTCHQDIYETFIQTGMGQSFDLATHTKSAAKFDRAPIYDTLKNMYYKAFWRGDTLKIKEYRLVGKDTVHKRTETVHYIVGSGQHTNSHMMNVNGYVYQLPATFYTQKQQWDLPPGFETASSGRFNRSIGLECMSCHNAYPKFVKGSENKYSEIKNGVDCERCHGPGSLHVGQKSAGKLVDINTAIDYSIVNPAKLSVDLQFEICQRCHLQGNAVLKEGKSFYDFKPGMRLSEVMDVFMPKFSGREHEFIMASHVERLKQSKCFMKTMEKLNNGTLPVTNKLKPYKDALTCVTCHNPHVSVKVTGNEVFNNACKKCHSDNQNHVCTRSDVKGDTQAAMTGNCVSCHMPRSGTIDIPHVTTTDHYIRKPVSLGKVNQIKSYLGIASVNNPNPDRKTKARAYIQYYERFNKNPISLDSAAHYLPDNTEDAIKDNFTLLIYMNYLKGEYAKVITYVEKVGMRFVTTNQKLKWNNDDAWTDYRIGDAYYNIGKLEQAAVYLKLATELAPYNLEFKNKYGSVLVKNGKNNEAIAVFEWIIKENPKFAQAYCNLGYLYLLAFHNTEKAMQNYNAAIALDPDYEQALLNKAALYGYLKQFTDAEKLVDRVLAINPKNQQAVQFKAQMR